MKYIVIEITIFVILFSGQNSLWAYQDDGEIETATLDLDPTIRYGRLDNGFTYYIKDLNNDSEKLEMRLLVKAGSAYQKQEQLDFAHAIEHLAFKCAKDFPVNLLDTPKLYNSLGMTREDVFGQTGLFNTSYFFDIPSDNAKALDAGLLWFLNIFDLELTDRKIDYERGPLRQEVIYRTGDNLETAFKEREINSICPCNSDYSNFFEHNKDFPSDSLIDFYRTWYHPDRAAVVLVGDINNMDRIENRIKKQFSVLNGNQTSQKWTDCGLKYLKGKNHFITLNQSSIKQAEENTSLFLFFRDQKTITQRGTIEGMQRKIIWSLLSKIINTRINEVGKAYNRRFKFSFISPNEHFPAVRIQLDTKVELAEKTVKKVILMLQQVKKFGVAPSKFNKFKKEIFQEIQRSGSGYWIDQIQKHFVYDEVLPANKMDLLNEWLSRLSLKEFNALCKTYVVDKPDDIGIISISDKLFTEDKIRKWINISLAKKIVPYIQPDTPKQLMSDVKLGALKEEGYIYQGTAVSGAQEFKLKNGLKVVLDTTGSNKNRIFLHGFHPKGASCYPKEEYFSAINAPKIVQHSGVGDINKFALTRFLSDGVLMTRFRCRPYIEYRETGIKADGPIEDLEDMLQLVYLYVTDPRRDKEAFKDWQKSKAAYVPNTISADFYASIREFLKDSSYTPMGTRMIKGKDLTRMDSAYRIYQQLFGKASDFTFIVRGNFTKSQVLPLLQKYLGNLPNSSSKYNCLSENKLGTTLPNGPLYKEFFPQEIDAPYTMESLRYSLLFIMKAKNPMDWKYQVKWKVLGYLMDSKIQKLRYSNNAALYSIKASTNFNKELSSYELRMSVDCIPEELDMIRTLCKEMVKEIKSGVIDMERLENILKKESLSRIDQTTNYNVYRYNESWISPLKVKHYIKSITVSDIQKIAQEYIDEESPMEFVYKCAPIP